MPYTNSLQHAKIKFSIPDKTGYSKTTYDIPLNKKDINLDYCVSELLQINKEIMGEECEILFTKNISNNIFDVGYTIKSHLNDTYYNNRRDKPRTIIAKVIIS